LIAPLSMENLRMLRKWITLVVTLIVLPSAEAKPPNVIIIFMDDLGYGDVGSYGAKDISTPNIDRLARQGVRLTDCYAAAPLCTPTRAAFMTGRYQHRVGIENVFTPRDVDKGLSPAEPTLPRLLKNAGYTTGLVGKWHLGFKPEFGPNRHGFDEFYGFLSGAHDYYSHVNEAGKQDLYENERPVTLTGYITDEIARRAVSFIDRHAAERFFLDVAFSATHWPFQPPDMSAPPAIPAGDDFVEEWAAGGTRADYVRMLESADRAIGAILAALDRHQLRDSTLVIFTSDNGGEWLSRMGPLSQRKGSLSEGGIRVPCIFRWPARLPAGKTSAQTAITMDLTATILVAAGASSNQPLDGIDLVPILARKQKPLERNLYWRSAWPNSPEKALRSGKWKWISTSPRMLFPGQLFDLSIDPGERNDLAIEHSDLLKKFKAMYVQWEKEVVPRATATGDRR
jgi:arylsulfatase A-like enzyme